MTVEAHKQLDLADAEFKSIKKIFDLKTSGSDYEARKKTASAFRKTIEDVFATVTNANNIIQGKILIRFSSIKVIILNIKSVAINVQFIVREPAGREEKAHDRPRRRY